MKAGLPRGPDQVRAGELAGNVNGIPFDVCSSNANSGVTDRNARSGARARDLAPPELALGSGKKIQEPANSALALKFLDVSLIPLVSEVSPDVEPDHANEGEQDQKKKAAVFHPGRP